MYLMNKTNFKQNKFQLYMDQKSNRTKQPRKIVAVNKADRSEIIVSSFFSPTHTKQSFLPSLKTISGDRDSSLDRYLFS